MELDIYRHRNICDCEHIDGIILWLDMENNRLGNTIARLYLLVRSGGSQHHSQNQCGLEVYIWFARWPRSICTRCDLPSRSQHACHPASTHTVHRRSTAHVSSSEDGKQTKFKALRQRLHDGWEYPVTKYHENLQMHYPASNIDAFCTPFAWFFLPCYQILDIAEPELRCSFCKILCS